MLFSSVSFPLFATRVAQIVAQNTVDLQLCNHTSCVIISSSQHVPNTRETHEVWNSHTFLTLTLHSRFIEIDESIKAANIGASCGSNIT